MSSLLLSQIRTRLGEDALVAWDEMCVHNGLVVGYGDLVDFSAYRVQCLAVMGTALSHTRSGEVEIQRWLAAWCGYGWEPRDLTPAMLEGVGADKFRTRVEARVISYYQTCVGAGADARVALRNHCMHVFDEDGELAPP